MFLFKFSPLHIFGTLLRISLVFPRKDLCDARVQPEMSSYFQMKCPAQVYPPADQEQGTFRITATARVTLKFSDRVPFKFTGRITFKFTARVTFKFTPLASCI